MYFPKYGLGKPQLDKYLKNPFLKTFKKQHGKRFQRLFKSEKLELWHIYWSMWRQLKWKKCVLVICKMFGLFLNILTAGHKIFLLNRGKLTHPIQMQLSKKQKAFSEIFFVFLKWYIIFEIIFWRLAKKTWPS